MRIWPIPSLGEDEEDNWRRTLFSPCSFLHFLVAAWACSVITAARQRFSHPGFYQGDCWLNGHRVPTRFHPLACLDIPLYAMDSCVPHVPEKSENSTNENLGNLANRLFPTSPISCRTPKLTFMTPLQRLLRKKTLFNFRIHVSVADYVAKCQAQVGTLLSWRANWL